MVRTVISFAVVLALNSFAVGQTKCPSGKCPLQAPPVAAPKAFTSCGECGKDCFCGPVYHCGAWDCPKTSDADAYAALVERVEKGEVVTVRVGPGGRMPAQLRDFAPGMYRCYREKGVNKMQLVPEKKTGPVGGQQCPNGKCPLK